MKPVLAAAASTQATDEELVAALRAGSDEALEALFERYRDRITAYVRGMVSDHGRAEDIVQETFISALRSLRSTERPIIFRPWIYQIAKNACIDQFRRQQRAEEISLDSDDFKPSHEGRLSEAAPTVDSAVSQRENMHTLRQAFSGLPASQHEVLVLREFAGLSYAEIARRMSLSTAAVESVLFRARRGLKDEYDEIATGKRCRQIQSVIAALAEGVGVARDRRALARHVRHCAGCRQEAVAMGLGALVRAERRSRVRRALDKAASLLPIPPFFYRRGSGAGGAPAGQIGGRAQSVLSNVGSIAGPGAEQATLLSKAVVGLVAAALIGGGALVGENSATGSDLARAPTAAGNGLGSVGSPGGPGQAGQTNGPLGSLGGLLQSSEGSSSASSPPLFGGGGPAGSDGGGQGPGLLGGIPAGGGSAGSLVAPGSAQGPTSGALDGIRRTTSGDGSGSLPLNLPSVPRLGGGSGSGGGQSGGGGSLGLPSSPSLPVKPPPVSQPSLPSTPSTPTAPSAPAVPSAPALPPAPSVDSVTGTLEGATGGTALPAPSLPGL